MKDINAFVDGLIKNGTVCSPDNKIYLWCSELIVKEENLRGETATYVISSITHNETRYTHWIFGDSRQPKDSPDAVLVFCSETEPDVYIKDEKTGENKYIPR